MRKAVFIATVVMVLGGLLVFAANRKEPATQEKVPIIQDVPKDAIIPLDFPSYVSAREVNWLKDDDIVLGVSFEEDARAYPALILNWHEIVNEKIGGREVVITYCPLCRSGIVFDRHLDGRVLTFGNTGALYESDLVMYDRETQSFWYQVGGRSIKGPLEGKMLSILPSLLTTWQEWRRIHPETKVLSRNTGYQRDYQSDQYRGYDSPNSPPSFPVSRTDNRLPPKTKIVGVLIGDSAKAYPLEAVRGKAIQDVVGGQKIEVAGSTNRVSAQVFFLSEDGLRKEAPAVATFWFAWFAAHPDTQVYIAKNL